MTDTLHIVWTAINGVLTLLAMGFAAAASGKRLRLYTFTTMVVLVAAGALTSLDARRIQANLSTPLVGIWERVSIGVWLLWIALLGVTLLRECHAGQAASKHERHPV